jgi:tRNA (adenine22-N1)-methyltransferase
LKLSKRLSQIETLIDHDYTHIWDTCCDHGFLGTHLIAQQRAANVHLVDIVPKLITPLDDKLKALFSNAHASKWQTHCLDVSELPLQQYDGKHLVIIAGIGGDLMIQCLKQLLSNHPTVEIDFILCPIRQLYSLRQQLIAFDMRLKQEVLVKENNQYYEILYVSRQKTSPTKESTLRCITPAGREIWQAENEEQAQIVEEYREITLQHYKRMLRGANNPALNEIIQAYQATNVCK